MKVRDIMKKEVVKIGAEATVDEAIKKMLDEMITSLIVNSEEGYGILTRKDIIHKVIGEGKNAKKIKVGEVMSQPLLTVPPEMALEDIARLMAKTDIRRFPVMEEGKLIGLVSNSDIIKAVSDTIK